MPTANKKMIVMFLNLSIIVLLSNSLIKNGYFNKNNYDNQVLPFCYSFVLFLLFFSTRCRMETRKAGAFVSRIRYNFFWLISGWLIRTGKEIRFRFWLSEDKAGKEAKRRPTGW
jgi:hypothetical protein